MGERPKKCRMKPGRGSDLSGMDEAGPVIPGDIGLVFRLRFPRLPDDAAGRGSDLSGTGDTGPGVPIPDFCVGCDRPDRATRKV